jgi:hypothetical protein
MLSRNGSGTRQRAGETGQKGGLRASAAAWASALTIIGLLLTLTTTTAAGAGAPGSQTAQTAKSIEPPQTAQTIDLTKAVIVGPASPNLQERTALQALVEEVEKRSIVRLPLLEAGGSTAGRPLIVVGTAASLRGRGAEISGGLPSVTSPGPEGYVIRVDAARKPAPVVFVIGADTRGMLFGVGGLLRELHLTRGGVAIRPDVQIATAPKVALRGHQLGYRPKTNAYDAWTVPMWDQYIRDLALFGTNAIELIPPRSDDAADSPHFPLPQLPMMIEMSRIADRYGLDVWIWYPAMDPDYGKPEVVEHAVAEWADVLKQLPRVDAIFVPGGDPGHTQPRALLTLLEKQTASLHRYHPKAQMWMSPQGFTKEWMDEFYGLMRAEPRWLSGIVFGPQVRDSISDLRKNIPAKYPIRRYPDITHSLRAEFSVPDWDLAHALTSEREQINPRPIDETLIFRAFQKYAIGFITYSEGNNDDVNKFLWSGLGWNPDADPHEILRQYARYFIGERLGDSFAEGLFALERNWRGPLLSNDGIYTTLAQFQDLERISTPQDLLNWRLQQALYRAYYDAYVRARLIAETAQEDQAMERLRDACLVGALAAMDHAEAVLHRADTERPSIDWRTRLFALAEALYQSVHEQTSVERYRAISVGRGATLDMVDRPLNDRLWLLAQFQRIRALADENARLAEIDRLTSWTNPGPGGFYDDLGNPARQPHLVRAAKFEDDLDPARSGTVGFGYQAAWRHSWMTHAESFYDAPLTMRYTGLDTTARYKLRVVYAGDVYSAKTRIRLRANGSIEVAPPTPKPPPTQPAEYELSPDATKSGTLTLAWTQDPGMGGAGRGCQVAEVWLIREPGREND